MKANLLTVLFSNIIKSYLPKLRSVLAKREATLFKTRHLRRRPKGCTGQSADPAAPRNGQRLEQLVEQWSLGIYVGSLMRRRGSGNLQDAGCSGQEDVCRRWPGNL